ncbi:MAG: protein kinase [Kofleriaceae bacterium]
MASPSVQGDSLVGSLLGKDYRVLDQIGLGGMAIVYLVEHQTLLKQFAAKVLSIEHASSKEARARFAQEAHAASQLDHENIVTISDFGVTPDGRPFYVMELLRGRTLMARLDEGPMTIAEVVAVSVPVARALAHAHAEGVIHRDVKPENVFLVQRSQGRWSVKVLDFGIAKVTSNPALTKMGQALGSPMFMAPEACRGDDVDQRADLYSFGIMLYLMLTGRLPFEHENLLKVLQMQVTTPVPPLRELNPELSPELEAVVMRALAKKPDDRYPAMDALLFDLEAVLPAGSDNLLIQAQFGTSLHDTPFPSQSARMMAVSSQRLMIGDQDASRELAAASQFPTAPRASRKHGALITVGLLIVLLIGGVVAYDYLQLSSRAGAKADVSGVTAVATPAPVKPPMPPPATKVVEPEPAIEPQAEPTPEPTEPVPTAITKPAAKVVRRVAQPTAKRIVARTESPPKLGAAGSATVPPAGSATVTPAVVVEEAPRVDPAKVGSAAPVVPAPAKPPIAPVVEVGSLDATPIIASLDVNGPLPTSVVRRGVERILPSLRTCYRTAAKARGATPAVKLTLSFEVDESSAAARVSATGNFGSLAGCARDAVGRMQTQQAPDVGTVNVVVMITFRPI